MYCVVVSIEYTVPATSTNIVPIGSNRLTMVGVIANDGKDTGCIDVPEVK